MGNQGTDTGVPEGGGTEVSDTADEPAAVSAETALSEPAASGEPGSAEPRTAAAGVAKPFPANAAPCSTPSTRSARSRRSTAATTPSPSSR